jgi:hypothetical protein
MLGTQLSILTTPVGRNGTFKEPRQVHREVDPVGKVNPIARMALRLNDQEASGARSLKRLLLLSRMVRHEGWMSRREGRLIRWDAAAAS